jgi:hypothetical protein
MLICMLSCHYLQNANSLLIDWKHIAVLFIYSLEFDATCYNLLDKEYL